MKISLSDITQKFDALIQGTETPEAISDYALSAMRADDHRELIFEPSSDELKIFRAILYLSGVDLPGDTRDSYLHCTEDFIDYRKLHGI